MAIELIPNQRGFMTGEFTDKYGSVCSIQKSSLAEDHCIWLGVDDAAPKIMASIAKGYGIETKESTGWVDYPIPKAVSLTTRMHLTQEQVSDLLPILIRFVETGQLEE